MKIIKYCALAPDWFSNWRYHFKKALEIMPSSYGMTLKKLDMGEDSRSRIKALNKKLKREPQESINEDDSYIDKQSKNMMFATISKQPFDYRLMMWALPNDLEMGITCSSSPKGQLLNSRQLKGFTARLDQVKPYDLVKKILDMIDQDKGFDSNDGDNNNDNYSPTDPTPVGSPQLVPMAMGKGRIRT